MMLTYRDSVPHHDVVVIIFIPSRFLLASVLFAPSLSGIMQETDNKAWVGGCYISNIMDPPKSGQPLYSGRLTCPRLILPYISNLREADTSQLYKITSENGSEATPT